MQVPPTAKLRAAIEAAIAADLRAAADGEENWVLSRRGLEFRARRLLQAARMPESYLGWTMVALASALWQGRVTGVPHDRRLLLLPRCLRDIDRCPAEYDERGLLCRDCGACCLSALRAEARELGYRVLIAEGSPAVVQMILGGEVDAILGVGCLEALETTFDKLLTAGVPAMAVPLLSDGCRSTSVDEARVRRLIATPYHPAARRGNPTADPAGSGAGSSASGGEIDETAGRGGERRGEPPAASHPPDRLTLWRTAVQLFEAEEFARLCPPRHAATPSTNALCADALDETPPDFADPLVFTELVARRFMLAGGKRSRPMITLAAFDALRADAADDATSGRWAATENQPDLPTSVPAVPDAVKAVAVATEAFHKASLVHDDLEDDDAYRYGRPTLHRQYDAATAVNVGDYLIGLGYRLVAGGLGAVSDTPPGSQRGSLPALLVVELLELFTSAHTRLCEGQGAELRWRASSRARRAAIEPLDVLKIYALKTAPAFEAALLAGARMAEAFGTHGSNDKNGLGWPQPAATPGQTPARVDRRLIARFARHLGVAYQIVNDLEDWRPDRGNKRTPGGDLLANRPTLLWALAQRRLDATRRERLDRLTDAQPAGRTAAELESSIAEAAELYASAGVFEQAEALSDKHHARALECIAAFPSGRLRRLLRMLADMILDPPPPGSSEARVQEVDRP